MSALVWVVMMLLYAISLAQDCGSGFQVSTCSSDQTIIGQLEYVLTSDKLAILNWKLCPRSDSVIPQWRVSFELNSTIVFGIFCNDMEFDSSLVCVNNGTLVIRRDQFENQNGTYNFNFISNELVSSLEIIFALTGVYPLNSLVRVDEGADFAELLWLIFYSSVPIVIQSFRGDTLLTDGTSSKVDGITVVEGNECISTESGESTKVWNVFVNKPNSSAAGDYILVVNSGDNMEHSSATVHLIVNSISSSSTLMITPSTSLIGSPSDNSSSLLIIGILIGIILVILCIGSILIIFLVVYLKKDKFCNKRKHESPETLEMSKIEISNTSTSNRTRPSTIQLLTESQQEKKHKKCKPPDSALSSDSKEVEYTDSKDATITPQLELHRPDISMLSDLVGAVIPDKWELFGVQVGLELNYLNTLRDEHNDPIVRFIHLFKEWEKRKTSDFTWATVIKVLYSKTISEYTLAENILKKLKSSSTDIS